MNKVQFLLVVFLVGTWNISLTQDLEVERDVGLWTEIEIKKKVGKFEVEFGQQLRLFRDFAKFDKWNSDLSLNYKINKSFDLSGGLRYSLNKTYKGRQRHDGRYHFDLSIQTNKWKKFYLKYRIRFQKNYQNVFEGPDNYEYNIRNRLALHFSYDKQWRFFLSGEVFRQIEIHSKPRFEKVRLMLATLMTHDFGRSKLAIGMERGFHDSFPQLFGIVLIGHRFSFK